MATPRSAAEPSRECIWKSSTQAQQHDLFGGCTITYIAKNDASVALGKHDPAQGAQNITELASNQAVVGVVGPFNSGVAVAEMPISSAAGLVQISPSNSVSGFGIGCR